MRDFIGEVNVSQFDPVVFNEIARVADDAMNGRRREFPPDTERCLEDLPKGTFVFSDVPINHMGFATARACEERFGKKDGGRMHLSFMFRWMALGQAIHDGVLREWEEKINAYEQRTLEAVYRAAAVCELDQDMRFEKGFVDRIRMFLANS